METHTPGLIDFAAIDINTLTSLGRGEFGHAYELGEVVLKITSQQAEFEAAVQLKNDRPSWSCDIYQAEAVNDKWWIVKEKLLLPIYESEHSRQKFPGHFFGRHNSDEKWNGVATRPSELGQGLFHHPEADAVPCERRKFSASELEELAAVYAPEQRACFCWLMKTYWVMIESGYDGSDLWCNFGLRADGSFAAFDVARLV